ncbi:MAG: epoxyqueuosine reductase QueH [Campylobacterales bacterium]|nr:epoxyqueuosine reductase QueH [Campylobacterales bacterium]
MLVHVCCSVDSHYFFKKLIELYPNEKIVAFFYDPNIHPYSEYYLRFIDVQRSCKMLNIELVMGEYDYENWLNSVKGLEEECEGGKRCEVCFDVRLLESAKLAKRLGEKVLTTTLLVSPKKSIELLQKSGEKIAKEYDLEFLTIDLRKFGGTQKQYEVAKDDMLYKQNYCGCYFALAKQKKEVVITELISSVNRQLLPNSIEEKIELYEKRVMLENCGKKYKIVKQNFLNYRLLFAKVLVEKMVVESYIFSYSILKNSFAKCRVDFEIDGLFYFNKSQIKVLDIKKFNSLLNKNYKNVKELNKNPLTIIEEIEFRNSYFGVYDLSAIIILDEICDKSYEIFIKSTIFEDVREVLITF